MIENPRFYEPSLNRIKTLQQSIARKKRFSQNWKKAKKRLEKAYDHVTNQKKDFLHKLSRQCVDTYATICVEDLNISPVETLAFSGCERDSTAFPHLLAGGGCRPNPRDEDGAGKAKSIAMKSVMPSTAYRAGGPGGG